MSLLRSSWLSLLAAVVVAGCSVQYSGARGTSGASSTGSDGGAQGTEGCDGLVCDGACVDPQSDAEHCGACSTECLAETVCVAGLCRRPCGDDCHDPFEYCAGSFCECAPGLTDCAGACVDLDNDFEHCGLCNRECEEDQACGEGQCQPQECPGFADACDGSCTDTDADPLHCGGCSVACDIDETCAEGTCVGFNALPGEVCGECPCESVCDVDEDTCCFSLRLDTEICVFGPACP